MSAVDQLGSFSGLVLKTHLCLWSGGGSAGNWLVWEHLGPLGSLLQGLSSSSCSFSSSRVENVEGQKAI